MSLREQVAMATSMDTLIKLLENLPEYGRVSYVVTAKGDEVKTAFDIVDAATLLVSNTLDGKINPAYPQELQPRDRTRASSLLQVNQISKDLRPAQLTDSGLSSHGAPIIGEDNAVESGNGRTMGIIKAYQDGIADKYRDYLIEHAADYGLNAEKVSSMQSPVLVRRRLTKVDRVQFARDSNISDLQEMAASEKAFVDAENITPAMMALFNPSESGDLLSRSNDAFIRGFMTQVGATQAAGLVTEDGRPTRQLVDRVQNAIFAKAYKDARLVRMVAEEPDPDMRNVLTALNAAASDFVQMQAISGEAHKQAVDTIVDGIETVDSLDKKALSALKDAVDLVRQSKESGQHISDVIAQGDMFNETAPEVKALALFIVANNRSAKRMATAFKLMAQRINEELQHKGQALGDMFGGGEVSLQDILQQVSDQLEREGMQGITGGLFESVAQVGSYPELGDFIGMMLRQSSGIDELIKLVKLVSEPEPDNNDSAIALAVYLGVRASEVVNWSRALGINKTAISLIHRTVASSGTDRQTLAEAIHNRALPPAIDWNATRPRRITDFLKTLENGESLSAVIKRMDSLFGDYTSFQELGLDDLKEAVQGWAFRQNKVALEYISEFIDALQQADSPLRVMKALKALDKRVRTRAGDISEVVTSGKNIMESVGLGRKITQADMAKGWIDEFDSLLDLDIVSGDLREMLAFYKGEVEKVIGDEEKLASYMEQVFTQRNYSFYHALRQLVLDARRSYGESDAKTLHLESVIVAFGRKPALRCAPGMMKEIHTKVRAAFTSILSQSTVSDEQASEWVAGLNLDSEMSDRFAGEHEWRRPIDLRHELKQIYRIAGGKLGSLRSIEHEKGVRAYANPNSGAVVLDANNDDSHVLWHEIGHHLEFSNPDLLEKARTFLKSKIVGERVEYGNFGSRGNAEYYVKTTLSNRYAAKIYMLGRVSQSGRVVSMKPSLLKCKSTEVFSMAMQAFHDQEHAAMSVLNGDGLLELLLGCLQEMQNADSD